MYVCCMKLCVDDWYTRRKKNPVLFNVLKSCEKSTKCPYKLVFKSCFVMHSLLFYPLPTFCCINPHHFHLSILWNHYMKPLPQWVVSLMYLGELIWSTEQCVIKFADRKLCFLTCDSVIGQKWRGKRTPVYFVKFDSHQSHVKRKKKVMHYCLAFVACEIVSVLYIYGINIK